MKRFIICSIIIILIFFLSFYIGTRLDSSEIEEKVEGSIGMTTEEKENELQPAVSEEIVNNEHFILREENKYINVYSIDDDEKEELYLSTEISTEYLPETDRLNLKNGIHVYSQTELHEMLQDFE